MLAVENCRRGLIFLFRSSTAGTPGRRARLAFGDIIWKPQAGCTRAAEEYSQGGQIVFVEALDDSGASGKWNRTLAMVRACSF